MSPENSTTLNNGDIVDLVDEHNLVGSGRVLDALFNDVGGKLVLRQRKHLAFDGVDNHGLVILKAKSTLIKPEHSKKCFDFHTGLPCSRTCWMT